MDNSIIKRFRELNEKFNFTNDDDEIDYNRLEKMMNDYKNKIIPFDCSEFVRCKYGMFHELRSEIVSIQGFPLLSESWVYPLASYLKMNNYKCMEVMAGCGSLTKVLKDDGVDIFATDIAKTKHLWDVNEPWTDIENIDAVAAIEKYAKDIDIVIMSWPDLHTTISYDVLIALRECNPKARIIHIGESYGCTGCEEFDDAKVVINDSSIMVIDAIYQSWPHIYDRIELIK